MPKSDLYIMKGKKLFLFNHFKRKTIVKYEKTEDKNIIITSSRVKN